MRVALATCAKLPENDPDEALLLAALRARGVEAEMLAWDGPSPEPHGFDLCVLRSTWNYYRALDAFLAWAERVDRITSLWNPLAVVRWNTHKRYLRELNGKGVATVPTAWIERGSATTLSDAMATLGAHDVVVKPAVSAASFATIRVQDAAKGEAHARDVSARCDVIVQPYVASVEDYGERSIVWIDGAFTHAVRKSPRFGDQEESVSDALPIADDERALATAALATVEGLLRSQGLESPFLYARIDMARDAAGRPMIMELELVEPSLFLAQSPAALERFVDAIASRLRVRREEAP